MKSQFGAELVLLAAVLIFPSIGCATSIATVHPAIRLPSKSWSCFSCSLSPYSPFGCSCFSCFSPRSLTKWPFAYCKPEEKWERVESKVTKESKRNAFKNSRIHATRAEVTPLQEVAYCQAATQCCVATTIAVAVANSGQSKVLWLPRHSNRLRKYK